MSAMANGILPVPGTPATKPVRTAAAAVKGSGRWKHIALRIGIVVAVLALGLGAWAWSRARAVPAAPRWVTARVQRRDLDETIRATGTVQPLLQVQVGAQVSGRILNVAVDFNTEVHTGDLLAEIDRTPYLAQVAQARAALGVAEATRAQNRANFLLAERALARAHDLRTRGLNAPADLEQATAQRDAARAAVAVADAQIAQTAASLSSARTSLGYTRILAPIDGTVATRAIDPGQTVAASFQTPTLFVIANDLTHMRVIADVDEANIGKLREGMVASARVDAWPREVFRGTVSQLRITPVTTNGVVTYAAVIDVANPARQLRPGMTATITVDTQHRPQVLAVPNASLRFRPSAPTTAGRGDAGVAAAARPGAGAAAGAADTTAPGMGTVYVVRGASSTRVPVRVGITNGVLTEVDGPGLHDGDEVVVDETDASGARTGGAPRMRMF